MNDIMYYQQFLNKTLFDRILLCSPHWTRTQYIDQAGFELQRSTCLCLPIVGYQGMNHHVQLKVVFIIK